MSGLHALNIYFFNVAKTTNLHKLHVYYLHSYDTNRRKIRNLDDPTDHESLINDAQSYYEQKSAFASNKFVSDLQVSCDDDIYSFGYRFEYTKSDHGFFVASKYQNIKAELIGNDIVSISINRYLNQYGKSSAFMRTNPVRKMNSRDVEKCISIHHILWLLI